jgi:hypothetical protein
MWSGRKMLGERRPDQMSVSSRIVLATLFLSLPACWSLPSDFAALPLDEKVDAYSRRFRRGGGRVLDADDLIAAHGYEAAEAMVPFIADRKSGIPRSVAISIVWDVQSRGCDLRGSNAEKSLREVIAIAHAKGDLAIGAEEALDSIINGRHSNAASNPLPPGVCRPES